MASFSQLLFAHQISWCIAFGLIYTSILYLYARLFPSTWLDRSVRPLQAFTVLWTTMGVLVRVFQCTPIRYFWDPAVKGHCIKQNAFYAASGAMTMSMVTTLFFLPVSLIWKLQLSVVRKWSLSLVFAVGGL